MPSAPHPPAARTRHEELLVPRPSTRVGRPASPGPAGDPAEQAEQVEQAEPADDPRHRRRTPRPLRSGDGPLLLPPASSAPTTTAAPGRRAERSRSVRERGRAAVQRVIEAGGPGVVLQPQLSLATLTVSGYEALSRFPDLPVSGTERWFGLARGVGLGPALEAAAVGRALTAAAHRPAGTSIAVNVSPWALGTPELAAALPDRLDGVEIELTEQAELPGTGRLREDLDALRARGARIAIDDLGAGQSGLRRIMDLGPDVIKLDRRVVQGVSRSRMQSALVQAVVEYADEVGARVCAEGVEHVDDLATLADLDVGFAQGWLIGHPGEGFAPASAVAVAIGRHAIEEALRGPGAAPEPARHASGTVALDLLLDRLADVQHLPGLLELLAEAAATYGIQVAALDLTDPADPAATTGGPLRACLDDHRAVITGRGAAPMITPVVSRGRAVAVLTAHRHPGGPWTRREIRLVRTLAAVIAPVVDLLRPSPARG